MASGSPGADTIARPRRESGFRHTGSRAGALAWPTAPWHAKAVQTGFIAIYRWRVDAAHAAAFAARWRAATAALVAADGQGSLLGRADDGSFVAIALWPDRDTRDRAFAAVNDAAPWPPAEALDPILVTPLFDLWQRRRAPPARPPQRERAAPSDRPSRSGRSRRTRNALIS